MQTNIPFPSDVKEVLDKLESLWNYADTATQGHTIKWQGDLRRVVLMQMTGAFHRTAV